MTRLQEIMECMANDMKPSWDDIVWLIEQVEKVEEQQKEIEQLKTTLESSIATTQAWVDKYNELETNIVLRRIVKMEQKPKLDLNSINVGFIITGLLGMVEDEGFTPREAFMLLDEIKNQTFHALMDIQKGK
jgi:hypothetical protein